MPKKKIKKNEVKKKDEKILFAFLAAFLSIIGFVIALVAKRDDDYVMFYAKQSLAVFIVGAVGGIVQTIIGYIPVIGWIISFAIMIIVLLLWILSWVYALSGEKRVVPVIGEWADSWDIH